MQTNGNPVLGYVIMPNHVHLLLYYMSTAQSLNKIIGNGGLGGTFEAKQCRTEKFTLQKLHYIHNNPCTDRWKLADKPVNYKYSSASFYSGDKESYTITDFLDVLAEINYDQE